MTTELPKMNRAKARRLANAKARVDRVVALEQEFPFTSKTYVDDQGRTHKAGTGWKRGELAAFTMARPEVTRGEVSRPAYPYNRVGYPRCYL